MVSNGVDVAICGYTANYHYEKPELGEQFSLENRLLKSVQEVRGFFTEYFPDGMAGYLWNKIYKAELIQQNQVRFTDMRRYQDGMFNLDLFEYIRSAALINACLYHYKLNDVQDVFVKYPVNKFELICRLLSAYESRLADWGLNHPKQKERICSFFLRGIVSCIDSMYSPQWNFDSRRRKSYLRELAGNQLVKEQLKIRGSYGRYSDSILNLLSKRHFLLIRCMALIKLFLKKYMKSIFQKLKHSGGNQG